MIIDYDHNQGLTIDQKLQSLKESVQMALDELKNEEAELRRIQQELIGQGIFIATINVTTYQEVVNALNKGKMVFAKTPNSYGTMNVYPYAAHNSTFLVFGRTHYASNKVQNKFVTLAKDNTWTTVTQTLVTE